MASRFGRGVEVAKTTSSSSSSRTGYFKLDDGETAFVQFVTDPYEWITVDMHNAVPTKPKPAKWEGNWPDKMNAVCRLTKDGNKQPIYNDCYICENIKDPRDASKPYRKTTRTWALAVMMEEVKGDGSEETGGPSKLGKRIGFRARKTEVTKRDAEGKPTGESEVRPEVVFVTMGWKNFFAALEGAALVNDGTITNLVFAIKRSGTELDTTYSITSLGEQKADFNQAKWAEKLGVKITGHDEDNNPVKVYPPEIDIERLLDERSSDEYYGRFFDPNSEYTPAERTQEREKPEPTSNSLEEMKRRVLGYGDDEEL